jgi:DNA-binding LacI/PurR family transcriptional regulator
MSENTVISAQPKYRTLAESWRRDIRDGRWADGVALPTERELADLHAVSRPTVRQALDQLERAGLLRREQGRGTFVAPRPTTGPLPVGALHLVAALPGSDPLSDDGVIPALAAELAATASESFSSVRIIAVRPGEDLLTRLLASGYPEACRAGVVFHGVQMPDDDLLRRLRRDRVPCVLIGDPAGTEQVVHVYGDHAAAAHAAVGHLLAHGHRHVALFDGPWSHQPCRTRREGFRAALAEEGLSGPEVEIIGWDRHATAKAVRPILSGPERPRAAVVFGDRGTAGLLDVARSLGLHVPADLALIALDLPAHALHLAEVPLTAYVPSAPGYARAVTEALQRQLPPRAIRVEERLVVGRSCGCVERNRTHGPAHPAPHS